MAFVGGEMARHDRDDFEIEARAVHANTTLARRPTRLPIPTILAPRTRPAPRIRTPAPGGPFSSSASATALRGTTARPEAGRTAELWVAACVAFLSEGSLTVEAVGQFGGNADTTFTIWRIGTPSAAEAPAVKMRAVAAPNLFNRAEIQPLLQAAEKIEEERLVHAVEFAQVTKSKNPKDRRTRVIPLPEQKVLVVMGTENGIAGVESFIQAAEQAAAQAAKPTTSGK